MTTMPAGQAIALARGHQQADRPETAAVIYRAVLKVLPEDDGILLNLGLCEWACGNAATAVDLLTRALLVRPDGIEIKINLGRMLITQGRLAEGMDLFRQAYVASPQVAETPPFKFAAQVLLQYAGAAIATDPATARGAVELALRFAPVHAGMLVLNQHALDDRYHAVLRPHAPDERPDIGAMSVFHAPAQNYALDIGSGCNLRCAYCCEIADDGEKQTRHRQISPAATEYIDAEIAVIRRLGVKTVMLTGWGETTIKPGWTDIVHRLADLGLRLNMISNFAKRYSAEEIKALARFSSIVVSCDTVDPDIAKIIRNPLSIDILLENIRNLNAADGPKPVLFWNATVSSLMIFDLPRWVQTGADLGIRQFNVNALIMTPYAQAKGRDIGLRHLSELSTDDRRRAQRSLEDAGALAVRLGCAFWVDEAVKSALQSAFSEDRGDRGRVSYRPLAAGMTRACLDPWLSLGLGRNKVTVCCQLGEAPTAEHTPEALVAAMAAEPLISIRRGLLEGTPVEECLKCRLRPAVPADVLQRLVAGIHECYESRRATS